jgi:hypothetical protein
MSLNLPAAGDIDERVRAWLHWSRENRFVLSRVKIGDVELNILADMAASSTAPSLTSDRPSVDPYEVYGGAALQRLREQANEIVDSGDSTVIED